MIPELACLGFAEATPEIAAAVERVFPTRVFAATGTVGPHFVPGEEMEARGLLYLDGFRLSEIQVVAMPTRPSNWASKPATSGLRA